VQPESKRDLGSLEQAFVDRLVEAMSTFLLGGRAWLVISVNHDERLVRVKNAPRGKKPSWGGFVPQFLGFEVCREMKAVLTSDDDYPFLDEKAKAALAEWRGDLGELLFRSTDSLQFDGTAVTWWTFAGGRINQTLKYALEWKGGWKVVPDNFSIKIQGDGASVERVSQLLDELRSRTFWDAAETRAKLRALVPEYRLSKFQRVLPDRWQSEMVGGYLLDFEGTAGVLQSAPPRRPA
jgi:ATP-dependent Lhr-like helicase